MTPCSRIVSENAIGVTCAYLTKCARNGMAGALQSHRLIDIDWCFVYGWYLRRSHSLLAESPLKKVLLIWSIQYRYGLPLSAAQHTYLSQTVAAAASSL